LRGSLYITSETARSAKRSVFYGFTSLHATRFLEYFE